MPTTDAIAKAEKDRHAIAELTCDLTVIQHRLRDLRRWIPQDATELLDCALANVDGALDLLHAQYRYRNPSPAPPR